MRSNQWRMVSGDIDWKNYGATYGRSQGEYYLQLAVFTNLHEHDSSFENKYLLKVYQEQVSHILANSDLYSACSYADICSSTKGIRLENKQVVITNDFKRVTDGLLVFQSLVDYGVYYGSSDYYYGDSAYKLFKQAGITPFR